MVTVHLSEVPERIRLSVANHLIRVGGLGGTAAIELKMAAIMPRQDPALDVPSDYAAMILSGRMRRPR